MDKNKLEKAKRSLVTLANATELCSLVILNIAGNDISNTINGSTITLDAIRSIAQARFQNKLNLKN